MVTFNVSTVNTKNVFVSNAVFTITNFYLHNTITGFRNYCHLKSGLARGSGYSGILSILLEVYRI